MKKLTILLAIFALIEVTYSQDSTFSMERAFSFSNPEDSYIGSVVVRDLNGNGIDEIISWTNTREPNYKHVLRIYESGRLIHQADSVDGVKSFGDVIICDFNSDGYQDVLLENDWLQLEVYLGPGYQPDMIEPSYYFGQRPMRASDRICDNGGTEPFVITDHYRHFDYDEEDSSSIEQWELGQIWQGTFENGRPVSVADICVPHSLIMHENDAGINDYFAAGINSHITEIMGYGEWDTLYFQLFTSFNTGWEDPDSFLVYKIPANIDGDDYWWYFDVGRYCALEDIDSDDRLEWAITYWEKAGQDSFLIHAQVYHADDFSLQGEYIEMVTENNNQLSAPTPVGGVVYVDYNQDGEYEILLAMQDRPLRLIDPSTMEVIMSSDFVLPDTYVKYFFCGHFDNTGNLQILLRTRDYRPTVFNLPPNWTTPSDVPANSEPPMPSVSFLSPAYPNPFNSTTRLNYDLPANMDITVSVFNTLGQQVQVLDNGLHQAGSHHVVWNAENSPSGIYFVRLNTPQVTQESRITLVR